MKINFNPAMGNSLYLRKNNNQSYNSFNSSLQDIKQDKFEKADSISFRSKFFHHKNADKNSLKVILASITSMTALPKVFGENVYNENSSEEKEFKAKLNDVDWKMLQIARNVANKEVIEKSFQELDKKGVDDQKFIDYFCKRFKNEKAIRPEINELLKDIPQEFHDVQKEYAQKKGEDIYYILLYQSDDWNKVINAAFDLNQNLLAIYQSFLLKNCFSFEKYSTRKDMFGVSNEESDNKLILNDLMVSNKGWYSHVWFKNLSKNPWTSKTLNGSLMTLCNHKMYIKEFDKDGIVLPNSMSSY